MRQHRRNGRSGFTLIELLVVVLILAILMAIALPLYLSAVADSQRKTCRSNLQTISNAVQASRVQRVGADYATEISVNGAALVVTPGLPGSLEGLQSVPRCPTGGTYTVETGTGGATANYRVRCSVHGTFEPGVDNT